MSINYHNNADLFLHVAPIAVTAYQTVDELYDSINADLDSEDMMEEHRELQKQQKQKAIVRRRARKSRHKTRAMRKLSKKKNRGK